MNRVLKRSLLGALVVVGISAIVPPDASGQLFGWRRGARCCQPVHVCCPTVYQHHGHYHPGYYQAGHVVPHQYYAGSVSSGYFADTGYHQGVHYGGSYYVNNPSTACCGATYTSAATYTSGSFQSGTSYDQNRNYNQNRVDDQNRDYNRDNVPADRNPNQWESGNTDYRTDNPPPPVSDDDSNR